MVPLMAPLATLLPKSESVVPPGRFLWDRDLARKFPTSDPHLIDLWSKAIDREFFGPQLGRYEGVSLMESMKPLQLEANRATSRMVDRIKRDRLFYEGEQW